MKKTATKVISEYVLSAISGKSESELLDMDINKKDIASIKKLDKYLIGWVLTERKIDLSNILVQEGCWDEGYILYTETYKIGNQFIQYQFCENKTENFIFVERREKIIYFYGE